MTPHHVYGTRLDAERAAAAEQPDPTLRLHPLAQVVGTVPHYAMPTCESCQLMRPAVYQLCHRQVRAYEPFLLPECNLTPTRAQRPAANPKRLQAAQIESRARILAFLREHGPQEFATIRETFALTTDEAHCKLQYLKAHGKVYTTAHRREGGHKTRYYLWHAA